MNLQKMQTSEGPLLLWMKLGYFLTTQKQNSNDGMETKSMKFRVEKSVIVFWNATR